MDICKKKVLSPQGSWTALTWACYKGKTEIVQELVERGANPNMKGEVQSLYK